MRPAKLRQEQILAGPERLGRSDRPVRGQPSKRVTPLRLVRRLFVLGCATCSNHLCAASAPPRWPSGAQHLASKARYKGQRLCNAQHKGVVMASEGSITHWFREASTGNSAATEALWRRYYPELVRLARQRLRGICSRMADEEDVALSALDSFFVAVHRSEATNR